MADVNDHHDEWWVACCVCHCDFALPHVLHEAAQHTDKILFWCPYGHAQHFVMRPLEALQEQKVDPSSYGGNVVKFSKPKEKEKTL